MANTAEVLRLMRHAADLLDACDPMAVLDGSHDSVRRRMAAPQLVANGMASAMLRMVAAAMDEEPAPVPVHAVDPSTQVMPCSAPEPLLRGAGGTDE